jgi:hypothetical protein
VRSWKAQKSKQGDCLGTPGLILLSGEACSGIIISMRRVLVTAVKIPDREVGDSRGAVLHVALCTLHSLAGSCIDPACPTCVAIHPHVAWLAARHPFKLVKHDTSSVSTQRLTQTLRFRSTHCDSCNVRPGPATCAHDHGSDRNGYRLLHESGGLGGNKPTIINVERDYGNRKSLVVRGENTRGQKVQKGQVCVPIWISR